MIKLRVVGASPDHSQLILSNKPRGRRGSHTVVIDGTLLSVLQDAVYNQRENERAAVEVTSKSQPTAVAPPAVPPRELQRMLRAGMSVSQVAKAAGVAESYVEQFFPPVYYEREGIVREVRGLYLEKQRLGVSGLPLGEAVERNLAQRRVRMSDEELADAWTATRVEGQPWVVALTFPFRGRKQKATWRFDPRARELTAGNKLALDLGWAPPDVRPAPVSPLRAARAGATRSKASGRAKPKRSAGRPAARPKSARPKQAAAKRAPKRAAAKRAAPKRAAARRPTAKRAAPKRATAKRAAPRRSTAKRAPAKRTASKRPTAKRAAPKRTPAKRSTAKRAPKRARKPARRR